ncbi:uncharacterized protein LOC143214303 isoform X2 [Lasioglossum baleicum]|uniref:uncharacterized protein LOC143214303 isoform X2 n=1 Tax=Lasioglossum baleicum TaxID=434251 RepID=UPI003FCD9C69
MNIYNDIEKVTRIPLTDRPSSSTFICHNTAKRTPKKIKHSPPRNANLYTEDDVGAGDNPQEKEDLPPEVNAIEILSQIEEANCGINYSNENLEEHWKARQIQAKLKSSAKIDPVPNNSSNKTEDIEGEEDWLRKSKLHKNAAIRGLLKTHKISLHDLQIPKKSSVLEVKKGRETQTQNGNNSSLSDVTEEKYCMKLVQYPEDPEVYGQPLHVYGKLDENKYKDIDFTVPRIGKKYVVTPRQYYANMDDSGFYFVKKDAKGKK